MTMKSKETKKLHIGCGKDIKKGYINLDIAKLPGIDVVHDLNTFPYPFKDNTFYEILANSVIEHVDDVIKVVTELHRISKPNAVMKIRVPYFHAAGGLAIITHKHFFNADAFNNFTDKDPFGIDYYTKARLKVEKIVLVPSRLGRLIPPLPLPKKWGLNALNFRHLMSYVLGEVILEIYFELRVIK